MGGRLPVDPGVSIRSQLVIKIIDRCRTAYQLPREPRGTTLSSSCQVNNDSGCVRRVGIKAGQKEGKCFDDYW